MTAMLLLRMQTQARQACAVQNLRNSSAVSLHMQYSESACMLSVHRVCVTNAKSTLERVSNALYCCINGVFNEQCH